MGTYCTFCRVAGPDIFDPPEHLPTCRYYPVEAKNRDKTIQQQAERIGVLSASLELALNQQKIDQAENKRLKEALESNIGTMKMQRIRLNTQNMSFHELNLAIEQSEQALAAPPQKGQYNE